MQYTKATTVTNTIRSITRRSNSANGNPVYGIMMESGIGYVTEPDTQWSLALNPDDIIGVTFTFTLTERGRITSGIRW